MNRWILSVALLGFSVSAAASTVDDDWKFALSPYMWFAGLKGDIATTPPLPPVSVDISPSDAFKDTQVGLMLALDMRKGRHGAFADLVYTDVQSDTELVPAPINLTMKSTSKTTIFSLAYEYEIYRAGKAHAEVLAGGRYWSIDSKLEFGGGLGLLAGQVLHHTESWVDPAIGLQGRMPLADKSNIYVQGGFSMGGFGVGSDSFYDVHAALGYQFSKSIGAGIGYRLFDVDYKKDDFLYDVKQQGWLLGLTWAF